MNDDEFFDCTDERDPALPDPEIDIPEWMDENF